MGTASTTYDNSAAWMEPETAPELLRLLKVDHEPVARQWPAITAWLTDHRPTTSLRCSLLANGYGYPLMRALESREGPHPIGTIGTISSTTSTHNERDPQRQSDPIH
jgi:hypothetical protein